MLRGIVRVYKAAAGIGGSRGKLAVVSVRLGHGGYNIYIALGQAHTQALEQLFVAEDILICRSRFVIAEAEKEL